MEVGDKGMNVNAYVCSLLWFETSCMALALGFRFGKFQVDQILKKFMVKLIAHYSIGWKAFKGFLK